jgi:hypothetical protein
VTSLKIKHGITWIAFRWCRKSSNNIAIMKLQQSRSLLSLGSLRYFSYEVSWGSYMQCESLSCSLTLWFSLPIASRNVTETQDADFVEWFAHIWVE